MYKWLLLFVGVAGFEPTTSRTLSECANRAALHSEPYLGFPPFPKAFAKVDILLELPRMCKYFFDIFSYSNYWQLTISL